MNLHEYQAKKVFVDYDLPVPNNQVVQASTDVTAAGSALKGERWVVKAQVHAGGRGKAGGVKLVDDVETLKRTVGEMLGSHLVTIQTGAAGQPVNHVLIEETCDIARELYLGAVVDRATRRVVLMASTEGGMEIEKVAEETPEKILKTSINPITGLQPFQGRQLAFGLGLEGEQLKQFAKILA
nr:succinate--CoA ligase subunit beta [Gammaproteobacteria bacterium]